MENIKKSENKLTAAARALFEDKVPAGQSIVVALSGGMDSVSLLDAILPLASRWKILACHVNHGLSDCADAWEQFCRQLCDSRGVHLYVRRVVPPPGETGEHWARQARMQAFAQLPTSVIVAAHHADDQAETILFRVLRGTGAHGMGAIRACVPLPGAAHLILLRPWLKIEQREISRYARSRRLSWVEDDDNRNLTRRRNFLRRRVMPVVREYFPDSGRSLSMAATRFGDASALLADLADEDGQRASGAADGGLDLDYFQSVGALRLQNWLHVRLLRHSAKFSERGLVEAARQILFCQGELSLRFSEFTLRVWRRRLYVDLLPLMPDFFRIEVKTNQERHNLPQIGGALVLRRVVGGGLDDAKIGSGLFAQLRQGGERLHLSAERARPVSNLLRAANIAPWRRQRLPLLFVDDVLAAVPGVAVAENFRATGDKEGIDCQIEWQGGGLMSRQW
ncbi:MAG: tRNA lysidine(34) synthetase TilS [Gammaproteobacteria bacterium WSBS_2016_MAG_OTU1]